MTTAEHGTTSRTPLLLILGSLGVVFGDIGTSPLYAVNQIFFGQGRVAPTPPNILGAIGLIFWALTIVVTLKYIIFVLLADHEGQGGVFALLGLLSHAKKKIGIVLVILLLVLAAGLLFGEGLLTPAISILAAVEGLSIVTTVFEPYIIPITLVILTFLFALQYKGTKSIGTIFGPIMLVWFIVIGLLGLREIVYMPTILSAFNPVYAVTFLTSLTFRQVLLFFGALVLVIAGVESFYADMGHFGARPIRFGWVFVAYPALLLSYVGQGAYLLRSVTEGGTIIQGNIFYSMVPHFYVLPMVILAALATAIASQALISGAYSLVAQAVALNYLPRVKIIHTNRSHEGQIYVPAVNWLLYIGSAILILYFGSSTAIAGAYGFAMSGVMVTTSLAMLSLAALKWEWGWLPSILVFGLFALIDLLFFVSKSYLFFTGAYVPALIGLGLFIVMTTWHWGRSLISNAYERYEDEKHMSEIIELKKRLEKGGGIVNDERGQFVEAARTVIFLVHRSVLQKEDDVPVILRSHMRHSGSIPKYVMLVHFTREPRPYVRSTRYEVADFGYGLFGIEVKFGFMEDINLENLIDYLHKKLSLPGLESQKYMIEVGGEELRIDPKHTPVFSKIRTRLYRILQRFAAPTYRYFGLAGSSSLSTVSVPVIVREKVGTIHMPELDLTEEV